MSHLRFNKNQQQAAPPPQPQVSPPISREPTSQPLPPPTRPISPEGFHNFPKLEHGPSQVLIHPTKILNHKKIYSI